MPTLIGPYRIERELGRGGMGVVYLAHDTRLDRTVALKALPEEVARDPERLARFEREAKLLASLNHTNIGAIYDVVESEGRRYLALEHIEGESLAMRLLRGPLSLEESVEVCLQIASGLEAAHERGVIHRDLKPGNVMITPGDQVKIVDFGLAKGTIAPDSSIVDSPTLPASSPTITSPAYAHGTVSGMILGTAPYLSPEQARGRPVDRRTDIWSWGCILFECLTGKMAFHGETVSDTVAAILKQEPDWTALPKETPVRIRELIRRSLEKDPRQRLRDIGDARLVLTETARPEAPATETRRAGPSRRTILAVATFGLVLAIAAAWALSRDLLRPKDRVRRLSIVVPDELTMIQSEITPDGCRIVAIGYPGGPAGHEPQRLYVRDMAQSSFEVVPGTERARYVTITADSRFALFVARVSANAPDLQLLRVPLDGSAPPIKVADWDSEWGFGYGFTCVGNEVLSSAEQGRSYVRIPLDGRAASKPINFKATGYTGQFYVFGPLLPGGRGVWVEGISYEAMGFHRDIGLLDFGSGETKILVRDAGCPRYARTGHLLYTRGGVLMSVPFDLRARKVKGVELPVARDLRCPPTENAQFDLSEEGTLQTSPGGPGSDARRTVIIDSGKRVSDWSPEGMGRARNAPRPSPDGHRIAWVNSNLRLIDEIWVSDQGGIASRRLVAVPGADCFSPVWSPDGKRLAYAQIGNTDKDGVYIIDAEGGAVARIAKFTKTEQMGPTSWWGDQLLAVRYRGDRGDILKLGAPQQPGTLPPEPVIVFQDALNARFSPGGRAIVYVSLSPGRVNYVCTSAWENGSPIGEQVPVGRGSNPLWSPDGSRIFYKEEPGSKLLAANVKMAPRLTVSPPVPLLDLDSLRVVEGLYDILPDGRLVAVQKSLAEDEIRRFDITLNFFDDLKSRMGTRGSRP